MFKTKIHNYKFCEFSSYHKYIKHWEQLNKSVAIFYKTEKALNPLAESQSDRVYGVLNPLLVRLLESGGYELVSDAREFDS